MKKTTKKLYFIAIVVPEPFQTEITEFKKEARRLFHASHALNSPAHITLIPPFFASDNEMQYFSEALNGFIKNKSLSPVRMENFNRFGNRVIFVDVKKNPGLNRFQSELFEFFKKHFPAFSKKNRFHPHITVAFRDLKPEIFPHAWKHFSSVKFQGYFVPSFITLLKHENKQWHIEKKFLLNNH